MATTNIKDRSFVSDMRSLFESGEGADVTLVVGGSQLQAHSLILTARSPVFAAMLRNDMREASSRRIEITDVRKDVLRQLLCFMYTDTAPQLAGVAAELLTAANKYDLPLLKTMCEEKVAQGLSVDNAAASAVLAVLHSCPVLETAVVDFIGSYPEAMTSDGWLKVLQGNPEVAAHICSRVVKKTTKKPQKNRTLSADQTRALAEKLTAAAKAGSVDELEKLLAAGAPVNATDSSGNTALHLAVRKAGLGAGLFSDDPESTVQCLLDAGADVNARDSCRQTPVHVAAYRGDVRVLWELLKTSPNVDLKDRWGKTPLHWAAEGNNKDIVKLLLLAGASIYIIDYKFDRPVDIARESFKKVLYMY